METKFSGHTPGPWEYDELNFVFAGEENKMVAEVRGAGSGEPMDINGKLIAAAPSLLDRLKAMYGMLKLLEHCDIGRCPVCSFTRKNGHVDNCELKFELILTEQLLGINQTEVKP